MPWLTTGARRFLIVGLLIAAIIASLASVTVLAGIHWYFGGKPVAPDFPGTYNSQDGRVQLTIFDGERVEFVGLPGHLVSSDTAPPYSGPGAWKPLPNGNIEFMIRLPDLTMYTSAEVSRSGEIIFTLGDPDLWDRLILGKVQGDNSRP